MSRSSLFLLVVGVVALAALLAFRFVLGGWINYLFIPLVIGVVSVLGSVILDYRLYLDFFSMRTTKHGLNMGSMILLALGFLVILNFLSVQKNKTWDLTENKLFSLSEQSQKLVHELVKPAKFVILFRGEKARMPLNQVRETLKMYQSESNQIESTFYDTYVDNLQAQNYLNSLPDKDTPSNQVFLFVEYDGKRERVPAPFTESEITAALIKSTRKTSKKVYYLTGHGEKVWDSEDQEGLKAFSQLLEQYATKAEALSLVKDLKVPEDASAVILAGPTQPLLDSELSALREYAKAGGHFFVMIDPGQKHNLNALLKEWGLEFSNTYLVNQGLRIAGASDLMVAGYEYDSANPITTPFQTRQALSVFNLASEVRKDPGAKVDFQVSSLVKTTPLSFSISELKENAMRSEPRPYSIGVQVKGKMGEKEFSAVVFGDSDFVTNAFISAVPTNESLTMNIMADLTGEKDLISIRPKTPAKTTLVMTNGKWLSVVGAGAGLPIVLIILGSIVWYRRRSA